MDVEKQSTSNVSSDSDSEQPNQQAVRFLPAGLGLLALGLLGAFCLAARHWAGAGESGGKQQVMKSLQEKIDISSWGSSVYGSSQAAGEPASPSASQINSVNQLTGGKTATRSTFDPLAPTEKLNDGNPCADDEEALGGLCYKKCSLLTNGEAPIRLSAFSCSKSHGFGDFFKAKVGMLVPCTGYDVSGDQAGNGCPHNEGACLVDEEISLGKCYRQCSQLTSGQYTHRTSANTCCKTEKLLECIKPGNTKFDVKFNMGGGRGKLAGSHYPDSAFTESKV